MSSKTKPVSLYEVMNLNRKMTEDIRKVTLRQSIKIKYDINAYEKDDVINGLVFRIFSIALDIATNPILLTNFYYSISFRSAFESYVYLRYLTEKDDIDEYKKFIDYGIGQENLYKVNLEEMMDKGIIDEDKDGRQYIEASTSNDSRDEFIKISLKNWKDIYKLCDGLNIKHKFSLYYHPMSFDVHGNWSSIKSNNLKLCKEPLHALHHIPTYPEPVINGSKIGAALELFTEVYDFWIKYYGLSDDLEKVFDKHSKAFEDWKKKRVKKAATNK